MRPLTALGIAASLAVFAGCGDDRPDRSQVAECLEEKGLTFTEEPGTKVSRTTGQLVVDMPDDNRVRIYFHDSTAGADQNEREVRVGVMATRGELVREGDTIAGFERRPAEGDRNNVVRCLRD